MLAALEKLRKSFGEYHVTRASMASDSRRETNRPRLARSGELVARREGESSWRP
jgi:hypothetical protein